MKYFSERSRSNARRSARQRLACTAGAALVIALGCATYDGTQPPPASSPVDQGGTGGADAGASGGPVNSAGRNQGGRAGSGGASDGAAGRGGNSVGEAGEGGAPSSAGSAGESAGGKAGGGGSSGSGGKAGAGGTGGTGGMGGMGGSVTAGAGGAPSAVLLSQGKPATADSTQTGSVATLGNDGSGVTRWCAANSDLNHNWQVDLAALHTLSRIDISWEKAANYKFKIEGSSDGSAYAMLLDKQTTTSAASAQSYILDTAPKARWVKITVTGLPNTTTWASFYELQVFGY
jgi:F5/8 type C domain